MQYLLGYFEDVGALLTNSQVNALPGSMESRLSNNNHVLERDAYIIGAYVQATSLTAARFTAPSLRTVQSPRIRPVTRATQVPTDPNFMDLRWNPIKIMAREELGLEISNDLAAGTENTHGLYWISEDMNFNSSRGPLYIIRATGTTTLTADAWTLVTPTYETNLPAGRYEIVSFEYFGATAIAARLVNPGQWWRPGVLAQTSLGNRTFWDFTGGGFGSYGVFDTVSLPQFECLANAADTAEEFYLYCVRR